MGAFTFLEPYLEWVLEQIGAKSKRPAYAGRAASAATATGQMAQHVQGARQFAMPRGVHAAHRRQIADAGVGGV